MMIMMMMIEVVIPVPDGSTENKEVIQRSVEVGREEVLSLSHPLIP